MKMGKVFLSTVLLGSLLTSSVAVEHNDAHASTKKSNKVTIAHRGASGYAPEHTFASYDLAKKMKADYLEIDLQMTKDNVLVAMHDTTVDRTTNGKGRVKDKTLKQIQALDNGSWYSKKYKNSRVPTLNQIFSKYGKNTKYYIEVKSPKSYPNMEKELLRSLKRYGLSTDANLKKGNIIIQSFDANSLKKIKKQNPKIQTTKLMGKDELLRLKAKDMNNIRKYAEYVGPDGRHLTEWRTGMLHKSKLKVHPYTINSENEMKRMNKIGVDGVFTNYPDRYSKIKK